MTVTDAWNGQLGRHWADHPDRYNAMVARFDEPLFDAAAIGTEDRVVDIGCGNGFSTRRAARRAPRGRVTGVDVSVPLLERARADTDAGEYPRSPTSWGTHRSIPSSRPAMTWRSAGAA